eukprot:TRINITY_DN4917_c0_g1_i1.p1 TRINITY_DN4917_c0_g1~~TRINITY_DN4917_c0_g1_i1.p1  ORF type:complete len:183 (-),score=35.36 TRINITY_DN4917_c0_g1_i1:55-603(-)
MLHEYLVAGSIFKSMEFLRQAVTIAEDDEELPELTETEASQRWECSYVSSTTGKPIKVLLRTDDISRDRGMEDVKCSGSLVTVKFDDPNLLKQLQHEALKLNEEIKRLQEQQNSLILQQAEAKRRYEANKHEHEKQKRFKLFIKLKGPQVFKDVKQKLEERIDDKLSFYKSSVIISNTNYSD